MEDRSTSARTLTYAWVLFCLLGCFSAAAQGQGTTKSTPPKAADEPSELVNIAQQIQDLTTSVPPELAAYAFLRLVETNAVRPPEQQRHLIEQAYMLARNIARKVEDTWQYPGQIRVTIVRETRCIEFAK